MRITRLLLCAGFLWLTAASQAVRADNTITNCAEVTKASPADVDSTPGNFATAPNEDDGACAPLSVLENYDLGDAPVPYPTTLAADGARHVQTGNTVYLGSCVDTDADGKPSSLADGDNSDVSTLGTLGTCGSKGDEDGVTFPASLQAGEKNVTLTVTANKSCKLNAWIDWAGNSSWGDVGDQIAKDVQLAAGSNTLTLDIPSSANPGSTYARVRCSTAGGDGITGAAADGEIEDYRVTIGAAVPKVDLKKYVQAKTGAPAYDHNNEAGTLGDDAQEFVSGIILPYGSDTLYRIRVENSGSTKLGSVTVDDQIEGCDPLTKIYDSNTANAADVMDPGEVWVMECTLPALKQDIVNIAKVRGIPINDDGTPTGQSPVDDADPANVRIAVNQPAIDLKKYVVAGGVDNDAQDAGKAVLVDAGSTVNYKIVVSNIGNTILGSVNVDDQLQDCTLSTPSGDTGNDGLLGLGEIWTYTCSTPNVRVDTENYATVTATPVHEDGKPTGQSPVTDGDPANVRIPLGQPAIQLKKYVRPVAAAAGSAQEKDAEDMSSALMVAHGDTVTYRMVVRNIGNTPLINVALDEHMAGCTVSQTVGTGQTILNPGAFWEYECTKADMTADQENVADVQAQPANPDGTPTTQSPVRDLDPANVKILTADPSISLKKYVVANGTDNDAQDAATAVLINSGSTVNYKIVVTNTGSTVLGSVNVDDQLAGCTLGTPQGDTGNDSRLSPAEVWTYTCSVTSVTVDTYNLATVTATPINADDGTPTGQSPVTDSDPANVRILLGQPAISLKKYVQDAATAPAFNAATPQANLGNDAQDMSAATMLKSGANALYRMVVTNTGNTPLAQVVLSEHLDSCAVSRVYNGDADAKDLLSPGEFWVYQCTKSNITVDMQNVASVEAKPANPDGTLTSQSPVTAEDPANVRIGEGLPSIQLKKYVRLSTATGQGNDAQDSLHALMVKHGDTVTYRIEVKNTGATALSNVAVEDHLPGCNLPTTPMSGDAGTTGLMEVGETWIYECNQANVTADVYNMATVTAVPAYDNGTPTGQSPVGAEDPAVVRIPLATPSIELKKYVRVSGDPAPGNDAQDALHALLVNHGSNVTYRIEVRNTGSTALANVAVEDALPGCNLPTNPQGDTNSNHLLETGEIWSYECTQSNVTTDVYNLATVVAQPANDDGTLTNQSPVMAQDPANVRIPVQQPALELKKYVRLEGTAAPGNDAQDSLSALLVKHGDNVVYRIVVRNTGNTALGNVKVDDHLAGCSLPSNPQSGDNGNGLLDTGETWVYECTQDNVTADVYNLATVVATPANTDGTPTGQSPITAEDPANVRIPSTEPAIALKKYVRLEGTPAASGLDAQDSSTALTVDHNANVTYRIVVRNIGATSLASVKVEDHLDNCALAPVDMGDMDAANILKQGETWIFECTQTGVKLDTYNLATVEATPIHDDGTPTGQSPVDAEDPANVLVRKTLPAISLKKYVRPQGAAAPGNDAQDALHALTVNYGSNVTYRIEVRNTGNAPLAQVKVDDHLPGCTLPANPASGDSNSNSLLDLTEVWVYECDQTSVTTDVYNLATVAAVPANADGTPTNQSPVTAEDPANVHIQVNGPAITLKKYVQPATGAPAYDANNIATLGIDAQDTLHAQQLEFGQSALFRIVIKNTGTTWLDTVVIKDHLETCNPFNRIYTSVDNNDTMAPGEFWVYECTVPNVTENLANLATVEARPINPDSTPTGQSPVDSEDMANVMIPVKQPAIALKKYVRKVGDAAPGIDAQDSLNALTIAHGDSVIYNIQVRNVGSTVLGKVNVDDNLQGCALNPVDLADGDSLLGIGEVWTYECTQANVTADVYNLATATATPVYADGTPTGQSPVNANDPANVRIPLDGPSITVKKYVQDAASAKAYVAGDVSTLGADAQDATTAAYIPYDGSALYRIAVQNTGNTWLDQVKVDDSLANCALSRIDRGDADINDTLKPGETWVYECTLAKVDKDIRNLATATARPIHADLAPTGQSPVTSTDPAHVTTERAPKIAIRKYVQDANGAPAYASANDATLGYDAEDATSAAYIKYDGTALYRITVTNTGNTWLDQVAVDDQLDNCNLQNIDKGDGDNTLKPAERWVYECTLANIRSNLRNTATVEARPINPDGTPTNQSPVDDSNVAHVTTELAPKIALKKYAQDANGAPAYSAADDATLGQDAEDVNAAAYVPYDGTALYRITVTNTGNTWLDQVAVDDQLVGCDLKNIDKGDGDDKLKPEERWVYECTQAKVEQDIRNTATVEARPINPDGTPTNQSPVDDSNVAHVTTELAPKIALKTYVQDITNAPAYKAADDTTLGLDAQDAATAAFIPYDGTALYRITVTNTGNTWLDTVNMDPHLTNCANLTLIDKGDGDDSLKPAERWVYECSLAKVNENVGNTATVDARPINPDGSPTNQSPVSASDPANITTEPAPKITLKTYVQDDNGAPVYNPADPLTLGQDAQDAATAAYIPYDGTALYRIVATNTGNTWLDNVDMSPNLTNCASLTIIDKGDGNGSLRPGEFWVYECTLAKVNENVANTATVTAHPINPDGTPTNQSPVNAADPANITTEPAPKIMLKTYVQDNNGSPAYDPADPLTLGQDAQDASTAAYIPYDKTALYRIVVTNTGNTWLDNVVMEPNLANCANLTIIDKGDGNNTMLPGEVWVYECTLDKVNENVSNTATVTAHPVNPDGTPTNQSPVNASDPANITTEPKPGILLKKYAQPAATAKPYNAADDTTLGLDAQDDTSAAYIMYDASALYYITVTNTGNTWLKDITVDDKLAACSALQTVDNGDGDAYLRPNERWVYSCQLDHVKQPVSNLATVQAYAINPDLTPTNQAPVTSEDVANIRAHKGHSIGNYVWVDDGNGLAANRNNGIADAGEKPVPDGVVLELNDASGKPVNLGNGALTTLTSGGYYLFSALPPGQYQVCVAASNFADGAPLAGYVVSTANESDPNADKDQNNDGLAPVNGKVCSGILTLDDSEPVKEFPTASGQAGNDAAGSEDMASNLTVDFAFVPVEVGVGNRLWIDEGISAGATNNGIYDQGEAPLADMLVEIYKQGQDPDVDAPVATTTSDLSGCYSFEHLTAGSYFAYLPYDQSVVDGSTTVRPLYAYVSSKGDDGDTGIDDDKGENGIDQPTTSLFTGIRTSPFVLSPGKEPTGERQCGKLKPVLDDSNYDGTKDIGVVRIMQLGDRVWFDRNANGVQDNGEANIPDATVELFQADGTTPATDIYGNPVAAEKTDANGKYLFNSLAQGDYVVRVTPPQADYLASPKSVADPNNDAINDSNALAVPGQVYAQSGVVKLAYDTEPTNDGDQNPNSNLTVDFGFYIPVAVGDRVWLDHNGNGQQDPEDLNISGATVSLFAADGVTPVKDAEGNTVADQTTDRYGLYLFDKLLEGDYVVKVKAPSEVYLPTKGGADPDDDPSNTDSNALPLVDGVSSSLPVTLTVRSEPTGEGDNANPRDSSINRTVDFGFIRPLAVGDFIWGDNNADGIQTEGETGLKGSQVSLLTTAGGPVTDLKGQTVAPVTVDETGAYHFEMLMEGDYIVRVTPPEGFIASKALQGGNTVTDSNCVATPDGLFQTPTMTLLFNRQPETTVDGDNSDRDMTVDCGFFHPVGVGNYIWADLNGNGLQDNGEPGLAGSKVELLAADGKSPVKDIHDQPVAAQTTGADGKYAFNNLMPGDYVVQVTPPEGYRVTSGGADPDDEPSNLDNNCVAVGDTFQTKPVTLFGLTEPATEVDGDDTSHNSTVDCGFFRTATLGGRLWVDMDMDGKQTAGEPSLSDMQLTLTDATGQPVKDIFGEVVKPVKAAANGEYAFANLMAGKYIVTAQIPPAYKPTKGVADPNNDDDTDSNGYTETNGFIASGVVDLSWDSEPVSEDGDPSTNLTIDFGFIPQVSIPALSEWGLILMSLMLMMAGAYWQRRRLMK